MAWLWLILTALTIPAIAEGDCTINEIEKHLVTKRGSCVRNVAGDKNSGANLLICNKLCKKKSGCLFFVFGDDKSCWLITSPECETSNTWYHGPSSKYPKRTYKLMDCGDTYASECVFVCVCAVCVCVCVLCACCMSVCVACFIVVLLFDTPIMFYTSAVTL